MQAAMTRPLVCVCLSLLGLLTASLACGAPAASGPSLPAAESTSARRTEVARVQTIISNPSTATPQPAATATPAPSCPNAIWWTDARTHIGETRTIQGQVVGTRPGPTGGQLIEVGLPYPDPLGMAIVLNVGDASRLSGKSICATGRIGLVEGRPTLQLQDASGVKLVD
jgi:hypothetical protein